MTPMKVDLKKQFASYSARRNHFDIIDVPTMQFLMLDGRGDPNTSAAYKDAIETLYPVAYAMKFLSKKNLDRDYAVMPLEALWWADDMASFTLTRDKTLWHWRLMVMVPEWLGREAFEEAVATTARKKPLAAIDALRFDHYAEGLAVQTLHIGPYDDEGPVLAAMHDEFIPANGLEMTGRHHEIYLGDPRRSAPDKLRTILRQPVRTIA